MSSVCAPLSPRRSYSGTCLREQHCTDIQTCFCLSNWLRALCPQWASVCLMPFSPLLLSDPIFSSFLL